ncbi:MAG TPA: pyridoxal-phosphate dependent enzyme [Jatrophihabitantaceae bacterium]|jgi:threonine dehydratase|nr:pyridoxal-phosphate dependent enzyme [Jatrophihabitantaceae bacterium]
MTASPTDALPAALAAVRALLPPTPLVQARIEGAEVYFKLETMQPTGSFKVRGAVAAVAAYGADNRIVTASAGNHGLGVAFAASRLGAPATVFVPASAPSVKIDALRTFDVDLRVEGESYDDAERLALGYAADHGRFVSAYSDPQVIAGQATVVAEVAEALAADFTIVVPVGGGGLAAGTALGAARTGRAIDVVGVEASQSMALSAAVHAGRVVEVPVGATIADGLAGNIDQAAITPQIVRDHGVELIDVREDAIRDAVRRLAIEHGLIVEGSAAVGLAAVLTGKVALARPTVLVLTGRNITAQRLAEILGS